VVSSAKLMQRITDNNLKGRLEARIRRDDNFVETELLREFEDILYEAVARRLVAQPDLIDSDLLLKKDNTPVAKPDQKKHPANWNDLLVLEKRFPALKGLCSQENPNEVLIKQVGRSKGLQEFIRKSVAKDSFFLTDLLLKVNVKEPNPTRRVRKMFSPEDGERTIRS
jgi:hypothetical protein